MIVVLIRLFILALIGFLIYKLFKYVINPKRKLELAQEQQKFYLLDDPSNVRKNFFITYKGAVFEGEKYLGTTDHAFEVVSIFIWVKNVSHLQGFTHEDFEFLKNEVMILYPNAKVDWKSPIKELMEKHRDE